VFWALGSVVGNLGIKIPPKLSISVFMGYLKGKSALMIFDKFPEN
jgi:putative transposase